MRAVLAALAALTILGAAQAASAQSVGMPPTDRAWTPRDVTQAATALQIFDDQDLPRATPGGVLDRLAEPATMASCHDRTVDVNQRMRECFTAFQGFVALGNNYAAAFTADASRADDVMRLSEGMVLAADAVKIVADEFAATLDPSDPTYERRMGGMRQANQGLQNMMRGAITMLTERSTYSDAARARFAGVVASTYPRLTAGLTPEARAELDATLRTIAREDQHAGVRTALAAYAGD